MGGNLIGLHYDVLYVFTFKREIKKARGLKHKKGVEEGRSGGENANIYVFGNRMGLLEEVLIYSQGAYKYSEYFGQLKRFIDLLLSLRWRFRSIDVLAF